MKEAIRKLLITKIMLMTTYLYKLASSQAEEGEIVSSFNPAN
jgi:hypothetical protein